MIFLDMKFADNGSSFPHLKVVCICPPWLQVFSPAKLMLPLSCFQGFCLSLIFQSLTMMRFSTGFFSFILFVIHMNSWIYRLIFPSNLDIFQLPVSLCFMVCFLQYFFPFSNVLSLSFPSLTPVGMDLCIAPQAPTALFTRVYRTGLASCVCG